MGVSAFYRNIEELAGQHIGGTDTAADHGSTGAVDTGVRSLRPAQTELHDTVALGSVYHAGALGGNQALVIDDIQNSGFYQLGFHNRRDYLHQRLPRKYDGSLRNRIDIAGEMEIAQVFQKVLVEELQTSQIFDVVLVKGQILNIIDDLVKARRDGKAVAGGIFPVKGVENNSFIGVIFEIALHHGELIKIGQQSQVHCTHNRLRSFAISDSDGPP